MEIREIERSDLDAVKDLRIRAFGPKTPVEWELWHTLIEPMLGTGRFLAGFDGTRMVCSLRIIEFGQWWHGRAVSMGGVSGVTVAPEDRGRGAGRTIMTEALAAMAGAAGGPGLGHCVSVLYPATTPLYRSLGWEHAGASQRVTLPTEGLRTVAGEPVKVRRAAPEDAAEVVAVIRRTHAAARDSGPVDWGEQAWRAFLADPDTFCYLADDGFLNYRWSGADLQVDHLVAASEGTARALWGVVGSGSSTARSVDARIAPNDPALWLLRERSLAERIERSPWMLRLVDAPAAIASRGFPASVTADVPISTEDRQLPENSGVWRLQVGEGRGSLERTASGEEAVSMGVGAFSALYAGVPTAVLRRSGRLHGPEDHDAVLDAAFAATPFSLDFF